MKFWLKRTFRAAAVVLVLTFCAAGAANLTGLLIVAGPAAAMVRASELAGANGLILATGSLYLAGALRPELI